MNCPSCQHPEHHVLRSRPRDAHSIRRTRRCDRCRLTWTTLEQSEAKLAADRAIVAKAGELADLVKGR